jgi:hypothetical protein
VRGNIKKSHTCNLNTRGEESETMIRKIDDQIFPKIMINMHLSTERPKKLMPKLKSRENIRSRNDMLHGENP